MEKSKGNLHETQQVKFCETCGRVITPVNSSIPVDNEVECCEEGVSNAGPRLS